MSELENTQQNIEKKGGSGIIGRVLPGAVRLWLRSQLKSVEKLDIRLEGGDREIISGRLPGVTIGAKNAVYKGIHLGSVGLSAEDIRVNIGQVVRGKPLRLLKGFPITGEVALSARDLNDSMGSSLLKQGVTDFWRGLVRSPGLADEVQNLYGALPLEPDVELQDVAVALGDEHLGLSFYPRSQTRTAEVPIVLCAKLAVASGHLLQVSSARWLPALSELDNPYKGETIQSLEGFEWDLGEDTQISELSIEPEQLVCIGKIQVRP